MKRAVAGAAVVLVLVAGCGSVSTTSPEASRPSASASGAGSSPTGSAAPAKELARHDQLFPDVAAKCVNPPTPTATPTPTGSPAVPVDPMAAKYAENHGFKQTLALSPAALCRGTAHGARITAALQRTGRAATLGTEELQAELEKAGYPKERTQVYTSGGSVGFSLLVPEAGPCVTGRLITPLDVRPHGPYMEGGCVEPKGGH
ncbi:hypothetical protein ACWEQL_34260 [Kitasatospora sp. NPDC004240]